jgi:hypothetical protein
MGKYCGREMMTKRVLATIGFGMVAAALIATSGGCSGTDDGTVNVGGGGGVTATGGTSAGGNNSAGRNTGGTAGGAGGASSQFQAAAQTFCQTASTLNCPADTSVADCTTALTGIAELAVELGCSPAVVQALYDCWAARPATDLECDANGESAAKTGVCTAEQTAADAC